MSQKFSLRNIYFHSYFSFNFYVISPSLMTKKNINMKKIFFNNEIPVDSQKIFFFLKYTPRHISYSHTWMECIDVTAHRFIYFIKILLVFMILKCYQGEKKIVDKSMSCTYVRWWNLFSKFIKFYLKCTSSCSVFKEK